MWLDLWVHEILISCEYPRDNLIALFCNLCIKFTIDNVISSMIKKSICVTNVAVFR